MDWTWISGWYSSNYVDYALDFVLEYRVLFGTLLILYVLYKSVGYIFDWITYRQELVTVVHRERVTHRGKSYYLIYTKDEVFRCVDMWHFYKFNSSDVYSKLAPNTIKRIKVCGVRFPMFSNYRNIVKVLD